MKLIDVKHSIDPYTFQPELELVISVPLEPFHESEAFDEATYEMIGRLFVTNIIKGAKTRLSGGSND